jgi:hypothetical protein
MRSTKPEDHPPPDASVRRLYRWNTLIKIVRTADEKCNQAVRQDHFMTNHRINCHIFLAADEKLFETVKIVLRFVAIYQAIMRTKAKDRKIRKKHD